MIVAALETNWNGDYDILYKMAGECKRVGVDYIKLQALSQEKLDRHPELSWYGDASVTENPVLSRGKKKLFFGI